MTENEPSLQPPPPPPPPPPPSVQQQLTPHAALLAKPPVPRTTYVLLGIFLGGFGIHNFVAGYTGRAIAQLLITVLTCGTGVLVTGIWSIIDVIVITEDAAGRPFV